MHVVGIDPGQTGALAEIRSDGSIHVEAFSSECWWLSVSEAIQFRARADAHFFLEHVASMPKQGIASTFKFGRNFGMLEGMLVAHRARFELVRPQVWQQGLHAGIEKSLDPKARSLIAVQRLFPGVNLVAPRGRVPHAGAVDALLIAEYGRRKLSGLL
jgi:crossover junction endodeoxyribonuclease RuvC